MCVNDMSAKSKDFAYTHFPLLCLSSVAAAMKVQVHWRVLDMSGEDLMILSVSCLCRFVSLED